ncbi:MAG TPA: hypothetical protein VN888_05450, partial [Mycobacterium sp.]|nr:hypothetical protein [Mycobacterium sp.]
MPRLGKISRRDLLLQTAAGSLAVAGATATVAASADAQTSGGGAMKPNIVFILADDFALNLVQFMPHLLKMQQDGVTFANYFVT